MEEITQDREIAQNPETAKKGHLLPAVITTGLLFIASCSSVTAIAAINEKTIDLPGYTIGLSTYTHGGSKDRGLGLTFEQDNSSDPLTLDIGPNVPNFVRLQRLKERP